MSASKVQRRGVARLPRDFGALRAAGVPPSSRSACSPPHLAPSRILQQESHRRRPHNHAAGPRWPRQTCSARVGLLPGRKRQLHSVLRGSFFRRGPRRRRAGWYGTSKAPPTTQIAVISGSACRIFRMIRSASSESPSAHRPIAYPISVLVGNSPLGASVAIFHSRSAVAQSQLE